MAKGTSESNVMKIITCKCKHTYQDNLYGEHKRAANGYGKGHKLIGFRCTVCAKEHQVETLVEQPTFAAPVKKKSGFIKGSKQK